MIASTRLTGIEALVRVKLKLIIDMILCFDVNSYFIRPEHPATEKTEDKK